MATPALAGTIADAGIQRTAPDSLMITWTDPDPVDIYEAADSAATVLTARLIARNDADGHYRVTPAPRGRSYYLLRDTKGGPLVRIAERTIPLAQGSNFRDIGGYPGFGGKPVRWGLLYRSGATPLLTDGDVALVKSLGIRDLVDLRSDEERVLAPTRLDGIRYGAIGYPMRRVMSSPTPGSKPDIDAVYRNFPDLLAPHLRLLFARLLAAEGPVAYNCSAGQDRTGFATAMILSALGVKRDVIYGDYLLSPQFRHPEYEMPKIDAATAAANPAGALFAGYQKNPAAAHPRPLLDSSGRPWLAAAFDEVEKRWGSVDGYLERDIGLKRRDIDRLRALYLAD